MNKLKCYLRTALKGSLPGIQAHKLMAPKAGEKFFRSFKVPKVYNKSSVMLILYNDNDSINNLPSILLTLRSSSLAHHSGQISFPGGRAENGEIPEETAIRETYEEIGIKQNELEIIGRLSELYVPPSNSLIIPVIAYYTGNNYNENSYLVNNDEVEEIFKVPAADFLNNDLIEKEIWELNGSQVEVPFYNIHRKIPLWGATAMIMSEFITIVKEFLGDKANFSQQN